MKKPMTAYKMAKSMGTTYKKPGDLITRMNSLKSAPRKFKLDPAGSTDNAKPRKVANPAIIKGQQAVLSKPYNEKPRYKFVSGKDNEKDKGKKESKKHEKSESKAVEKKENKKMKDCGMKMKKTSAIKTTGSYKGKSNALGGGGRFAQLAAKTGSPAIAAMIGRKKYGNKKMASMAVAGKKKA